MYVGGCFFNVCFFVLKLFKVVLQSQCLFVFFFHFFCRVFLKVGLEFVLNCVFGGLLLTCLRTNQG